ncbi:hypothetical protein Q0M94_19265 (plasmid) [Deinococcus radiomollis]|uniref:hypothetical protein n=1 Tax=Deinococcus radiomollis TaxID=468916 RepID=UPI0038926006
MTEIELLLDANSTTLDVLKKTLKFTGIKLYKFSNNDKLTRYKLFIKLSQAGYSIPWHLRPKCKSCDERYIPSGYRDYLCSECKPFKKVKQQLSLTPSDCRELGMKPVEAFKHLGLPVKPEYVSWYNSDGTEQGLHNLIRAS